MFLYIPSKGEVIPSIPDQASSIRSHCIFFLPIYIKVDVACILLAVHMHRSCLVIFFCPQSVKERFLGASVSESECKGTTFLQNSKRLAHFFSEKMKKYWKTEEKGRVLREFRAIKGRRAIRTNGILQAIRPARKNGFFRKTRKN